MHHRGLTAFQNVLGEIIVRETEAESTAAFVSSTRFAQGFHYSGGGQVVEMVINIAYALTNAIGVSSGQQSHGAALAMQAHIHIRWLWLLPPSTMVFLGTGFVGMTVWRTRRSGDSNWRSSILAIMDYGVNTHFQENSGDGRKSDGEVDLVPTVSEEKVSDLEGWAEGVPA
jgi:hypothetical protein